MYILYKTVRAKKYKTELQAMLSYLRLSASRSLVLAFALVFRDRLFKQGPNVTAFKAGFVVPVIAESSTVRLVCLWN